MQWTIQVEDEEGTGRLAAHLAALCEPGDLILLEGELGAGKTTLVRFICRALGVPEHVAVTSPTFALLHELSGRVPILHADLYRLGDPDELVELGLHEQLSTHVAFVEWGSRFPGSLGQHSLQISMSFHGDNGRMFQVDGFGERGRELVRRLEQSAGAGAR
jgi:tRNA threonylcarbamoyl adenosine modification protein YjeE